MPSDDHSQSLTHYTSTARRKSSDDCADMTDVRYEVDRLDRLLVEGIAERVTYMTAAARIKQSRDRVHDQDRIEDVVAKVLAQAKDHGLPAEIAEPIWRLMIDRCIAYEYERWDEIRESDT